MRYLFLILILLEPAINSLAQFNGILHYQSHYDSQLGTGTVYTTFYVSGNKVRVESRNAQTKSALGSPSTKDQNPLIFDFSVNKETHIAPERKMAMVMNFITIMQENMMQVNPSDIMIENSGTEQVDNFSCTHFVITQKFPRIPNRVVKRDVWITKDLGGGNLYYVGSYLYHPKGSIIANKILAAGGNGIVVKWATEGTSADLVGVEKKSLPGSTFAVPTGYTVMQR